MAGVDFSLFLFLSLFLLNSISPAQKIPIYKTTNKPLRRNITESCTGYKESFLTTPEKNYLLTLHASLRENITKEEGKLPRAFFMKKLTWNESIARVAQRWAERCWPLKSANPQFGNQPMGQLLAVVDEKKVKSVKDLFSEWLSGLNHLTPEIIDNYRKPKSGEFDYEPASQLLWWNTSQIGCGRSTYRLRNCLGDKMKNCTKQNVVELVCNYFPAGNNEGDPIYIPEKGNSLICLNDDKHVYCRNVSIRNEEENEDDSAENRIRNKMNEVWPAAGKGFSLSAKWDSLWFLISVFTKVYLFGKN